MDNLTLRPITTAQDRKIFIREIQEAFQTAYEAEFGTFDRTILPTEDIEESLNAKGAQACIAELDGERVGGAVVVVDDQTGFNSLHLLYVKPCAQNAGIGLRIWKTIEAQHPETRIWETHTPYYDRRNIHFYVNRCGFRIVEFFNPRHKDPHQKGETAGNIPVEHSDFFRFEKNMS